MWKPLSHIPLNVSHSYNKANELLNTLRYVYKRCLDFRTCGVNPCASKLVGADSAKAFVLVLQLVFAHE